MNTTTSFGVPIVSRDRQAAHDAEYGRDRSLHISGMYDYGMELRRVNRHGYTVITYHMSVWSMDYEEAQRL